MTPKIIVSYDDTANDHDALAFGRVLREAGAELALAYVRHTHEPDPERESLEERDAQQLLAHGAELLGDPGIERHVVLSGSTGEGLRELARRTGAHAVVFGSDYRTAAGHVRPNRSAQRLLEGGPVAVAIAPANLRERDAGIATVAVRSDDGDHSAEETGRSLAERLDAVIVRHTPGDLTVMGSRAEAARGRVLLSARGEYELESATGPVLVVPRGTALRFAPTLVTA